MKPHHCTFLEFACATVLLSAPAFATDFYVDAIHGSNANGGSSAFDAWQTLTHAIATIPATPLVDHTIHVAPGTYDPALGEVYPLQMRPKLRLVGTAGSSATILEGPASLLLDFPATFQNAYTFDSTSGAEGLTLRNADRAISVSASDWESSPSFNSLGIEGMQVAGVQVSGTGSPFHLNYLGKVAPTFVHVTISGCGYGLALSTNGPLNLPNQSGSATLTDCTIRECTADGLTVFARLSVTKLFLSRTRVIDNAGSGVSATSPGDEVGGLSMLIAKDTLFAGNGDSGIHMVTSPYGYSHVSVEATHCTIAQNGLNGVYVDPGWAERGSSVSLRNSNVFGNGDDLEILPGYDGESVLFGNWTNSGDGDLIGQEGCIAADPLFVNPALGDYRLKFGSPCIDTATPEFMILTDLLGQTRPFDGDLDTIASPDMGALEFAPINFVGSSSAKAPIVLELWGPSSGRAIVYMSGSPLLKRPETTPFGSLFLAPGTAFVVPYLTLKPSSPSTLLIKLNRIAIPPGSSVSLQALIKSSAAPAGAAYSNPLEFQLAP